MKTHFLQKTFFYASVALLGACSSEELVEEQEWRQITMTAADFECDDTSRTNINIGAGGGGFTWAENDTVGIFPNTGTQVAFPMTNGAGTKTASFNGGGWALKQSSTYAAYYPFLGQMYLNKNQIPANFDGQTQIGNASTAHLGKYDYMAAVASTPNNGNINFKFKHLGCLIELNTIIPNKGELTSVTLSCNEALFSNGLIDLRETNPKIGTSMSHNSLTINIQEIRPTEDNTKAKIYFMMAPAKLANQTIRVELVNNGVSHWGTVKGKDMIAGKAYQMNVLLTDAQIPDVFHVEKAGTLPDILDLVQQKTLKGLRLKGYLNGTDIQIIREMAGLDINGLTTDGQLNILDLYETSIVKGGDPYFKAMGVPQIEYTQDAVIGSYMFCQSNLVNIILPKNLKEIGSYAFERCRYLKSITLPNGLISIKNNAFANCGNIQEIRIPESVKEIGERTFYGCAIKSINIPAGIKNIPHSAFSYSSLEHIKLPNTVNSIQDYAFSDCYSLKSIIIQNGLQSIGDHAFSGDYRLSNVIIPESVTSIGNYAFLGCTNLKNVTIKGNITVLNESTFETSQIDTLRLPNSLKVIQPHAFPQVMNVLYCFATIPPALDLNCRIPVTCKIYVPKGTANKYKAADGWKNYRTIISEMADNVSE